MITITHDKILGFTPLWAPYNGFSLLFDNPDNGFSPLQQNGELMKFDSISNHPTLELYQTFVDALNSIDTHLLTNTYLFCPFPPSTYHVTVWDGLNIGNLTDLNPSEQKTWGNFVRNLPNTFYPNSEFTRWTRASSLTQNSDWNITFQYDTLHKWSSGMGILLKPADQQSERLLKEIENHREQLYKNFPTNIKYSEYTPHVHTWLFRQ